MAVANSLDSAAGSRRDYVTIGSVGLAHFTSHFLMLSLAPLLPLIKAEFDISFTQLGWVLTLFYATSGAGQVAAGILVDRFGPHRLLLSGIFLQGLAILAMSFAPSFLWLFPLAIAAGIGNTVYHPCDLSILSRRVSRGRQGRAFASHSMAGSFGFALSPVLVGIAASHWGWRPALMGAGISGLIFGIGLLINRGALRADDFHPAAAAPEERGMAPAPKLSFLQLLSFPVVMFGFLFFLLSALAFGSLMNFTVSALNEGYGVTLARATLAVALFQFGAIGGTMAGGVLADQIGRHQQIAIFGTIAAAALILPVVYTGLPLPLILACLLLVGIASGVTLPSRDLLIRQAAPRGNLGKTFGSVYSGLDAGSLIGPLLIGPMLDHGAPQLLFVTAAVAMLAATLTVVGISGARRARG